MIGPRVFTDDELRAYGRCLHCQWHPPTQGHHLECPTRVVWGRDNMTAPRWAPTTTTTTQPVDEVTQDPADLTLDI